MNVQSRPVTPVLDAGRHPKGKLGFVLLATEQTITDDMVRIIPPGIGVHFTRVRNADDITIESLGALGPELARAAATLLPDGSLDVISYACTSGSLILGERRVEEFLNAGAPGARATSIIAAVNRALRAVGARRIVVATPYLDEINAAEHACMTAEGFEILDFQGMNIARDSDMVRVAPAFIRDYAAALDRADAEAIFISCGALRSIEIVGELEAITGKPVIVSNQAMAWDAMRLAGIEDRVPGFGRLLAAY